MLGIETDNPATSAPLPSRTATLDRHHTPLRSAVVDRKLVTADLGQLTTQLLQVGWLFWSLDETFGSVERLELGGRKLSEQDQPPGDAMSREHYAFAATRPKRVARFDAGDELNRIAGPDGRIGGLAELFDDAAQLR